MGRKDFICPSWEAPTSSAANAVNAAAHASTAVAAPAAAPKAAASSTVAVEAAEAKTGGSKRHFFFLETKLMRTFCLPFRFWVIMVLACWVCFYFSHKKMDTLFEWKTNSLWILNWTTPLLGDMGEFGLVLFRDDFEKGSGVVDFCRRWGILRKIMDVFAWSCRDNVLAAILHSGQIIATKPPVGQPK